MLMKIVMYLKDWGILWARRWICWSAITIIPILPTLTQLSIKCTSRVILNQYHTKETINKKSCQRMRPMFYVRVLDLIQIWSWLILLTEEKINNFGNSVGT